MQQPQEIMAVVYRWRPRCHSCSVPSCVSQPTDLAEESEQCHQLSYSTWLFIVSTYRNLFKCVYVVRNGRMISE